MASRAGLLVRRDGQPLFIPADLAHSVVETPRLTRMPWDSLQMALVGGEVVPVIELSEPTGVLVLCELDGQPLALSGLAPERVSFWPEQSEGVLIDGRFVPMLDASTLRPQPLSVARERIAKS